MIQEVLKNEDIHLKDFYDRVLGKILADVSEGAGDLPVVVHDPYLTDPKEAERRAKIRLALNKEYGRSLRITMHQKDFKDLGIDLGDTCTINLPSVGLDNVDMVLLGIEYDPKSLRYRLEFGGRKELLEDWLDEKIGGDVARRFGKVMTLPEQTSTLAYSLDKIARIQADQKHVIYVNKPPITLYNAQNVILNSDGEVELVSGATEGSFEAQVLPPSELFVNWIKSEWIAWKKRYALSFRDSGDKIQRDGVIGEDQSFTAIVFAKIDEDGYFGLIDEDGYGKREWTCMTKEGQKLQVFMFDKDGNLYGKNFDGLPLGKVVMTGIMYDHENHKLYGILDGEILDTGLSPPSLREVGAPLSVGWVYDDSYTLKGKIYAAYVWNRVLSAEEVSALKDDMRHPPEDGLVVWWRLDEGSGSIAYDSSRNGNHGTIYGASWIETPIHVSAEFLNSDGESLGQVYDAHDTQFYRFRKWPQGYGSFTYRNASSWGSSDASVSDKRMGILHAYCLKLTPSTLGSDGEIYYPSSKDLNLDLSWAKWLRLYLYADHEDDVTIKIRLHQDADHYFEGSLVVKAKEWRKYEVSMDSLSQVGSPSLSSINWISIISPYPILIDSDHVFLPATRELMRARFTLKRDSPDDPSPKLKLVKIIWREGA